MTVALLPTPAVTPLVEQACASVGEVCEVALSRVTVEDLTGGIEAATMLMRRAQAQRLSLLAEAERRRLADQAAAVGTGAWVEASTGDRRELLAGGLLTANLLTANQLTERYHATRGAFELGRLSLEQSRSSSTPPSTPQPRRHRISCVTPRSCWSPARPGMPARGGR